MSVGAAIRIEIGINNDGSRFELTPLGATEPRVLEHSFNLKELDEARAGMRTQFESIKRLIGKALLVDDWATLQRAMHELHDLGRRLAIELFNDEQRWEVQKLLQQACPTWDQVDSEAGSNLRVLPSMVQVSTAFHCAIPFEVLPLFDLRARKPTINSPSTLYEFVRRFLGFSTIVSRRFHRSTRPDLNTPYLRRDGGLRLRFFRFAGLEGARKELEFFQKQHDAGAVDLAGPWPDEAIAGDFSEALARQLWWEVRRRGDRDVFDEIHHFACHCNTLNTGKFELALSASENVKGQIVSLSKLERLVTEEDRTQGILWPLVFLNACGGASIDPGLVSSFPNFFLNKGLHRGFIGTETNIPDRFAAEFSRRFYFYLLDSVPVGLSLHRAKWDLLRATNNPLGIFYTMYVNPDLRLEP